VCELPRVEALRQLGHDVLTAFEAGQANQRVSDRAVLEFATKAQARNLALDRRGFVQLHSRLS